MLLFFVATVLTVVKSVPAAELSNGVIDERWNAVFSRTEGWTGGDVAGTVDLKDGRMLWLFGDTWIGAIRDGKRTVNSRLINNSIAIHPIDASKPWQPPSTPSVRFLWGPNDISGNPTAWIVPIASGPDESTPRREWFWPTGGGAIIPGPSGKNRLVLFLFRVRRDAHGTGVWGFAVAGTTMAFIDNVAEPAERWRPRLLNVPDSPTASPRSAQSEFTWGMSVAMDPATRRGEPKNVLFFGVRRTGGLGASLVAARANPLELEHLSRWTFFSRSRKWSRNLRETQSIAEGLVSEFSVEPIEHGGITTWVLVQSEPFLGRRIFVRTARQPVGPWSAARAVYSVPEVPRNPTYFTYAAKGHRRLSHKGELLITYLVNSQKFADLGTDTSIYRPIFLRLPLASIIQDAK